MWNNCGDDTALLLLALLYGWLVAGTWKRNLDLRQTKNNGYMLCSPHLSLDAIICTVTVSYDLIILLTVSANAVFLFSTTYLELAQCLHV